MIFVNPHKTKPNPLWYQIGMQSVDPGTVTLEHDSEEQGWRYTWFDSFRRWNETNNANAVKNILERKREGKYVSFADQARLDRHYLDNPDDKILTKEEAQEKYGIKGRLTFENDIMDSYANTLRELKVMEIKAQSTAGRSRGLRYGRFMLNEMSMTLMDPANLVFLIFPPITIFGLAGKGAVAGMSQMARNSARFRYSFVQGSATAAALEPLIYTQAQKEQADYNLWMSTINIAFSGMFAGSVHSFGGRGLDMYRQRTSLDPTFASNGRGNPDFIEEQAQMFLAIRQMQHDLDVHIEGLEQLGKTQPGNVLIKQYGDIAKKIKELTQRDDKGNFVYRMSETTRRERLEKLYKAKEKIAQYIEADLKRGAENQALKNLFNGKKDPDSEINPAEGSQSEDVASSIVEEAGAGPDVHEAKVKELESGLAKIRKQQDELAKKLDKAAEGKESIKLIEKMDELEGKEQRLMEQLSAEKKIIADDNASPKNQNQLENDLVDNLQNGGERKIKAEDELPGPEVKNKEAQDADLENRANQELEELMARLDDEINRTKSETGKSTIEAQKQKILDDLKEAQEQNKLQKNRKVITEAIACLTDTMKRGG